MTEAVWDNTPLNLSLSLIQSRNHQNGDSGWERSAYYLTAWCWWEQQQQEGLIMEPADSLNCSFLVDPSILNVSSRTDTMPSAMNVPMYHNSPPQNEWPLSYPFSIQENHVCRICLVSHGNVLASVLNQVITQSILDGQLSRTVSLLQVVSDNVIMNYFFLLWPWMLFACTYTFGCVFLNVYID